MTPLPEPREPAPVSTPRAARARRRRWADAVIVVASLYALAAATWIPPEAISDRGRLLELRHAGWLLAAYGLGGGLGLGAVLVAFRRPGLARAMTLVAGLLVLSALLALRHLTPLALVSLGLTGVALLAAAPFMGAVPTPEEEGRRR